MQQAVVAANLTKAYGTFTAVDRISFTVRRGECFGFLGPNGTGKTSTIHMIHCVSPITAGSATVFGETAHIDNRRIRSFTGVIPQEITLDEDLTVRENLEVFAMFFDIRRREAKRRAGELIEFVELSAKSNSRIRELSTGMKRRLLIARALLNNPRLIIADEPTTGLDPQARHLIWQRLRLLRDRGATLLLTTQYMEEAEQLCDRLIIMYNGRILREGSPRALIEREIGREVVEIRAPREMDRAIVADLSDAACGHERAGDTLFFYCRDSRRLMERALGLNIPSLFNRPATLEDVFLKLTGRSLIE